jgi:peptidoglycan hydrolase CwlO-like protein
VDLLEAQVSGLRSALSDREAMIVNLQQENVDLQAQVDKLIKMVNSKDRRIRELEKQVKELTERIDVMNGGKGEAWVGGTD